MNQYKVLHGLTSRKESGRIFRHEYYDRMGELLENPLTRVIAMSYIDTLQDAKLHELVAEAKAERIKRVEYAEFVKFIKRREAKLRANAEDAKLREEDVIRDKLFEDAKLRANAKLDKLYEGAKIFKDVNREDANTSRQLQKNSDKSPPPQMSFQLVSEVLNIMLPPQLKNFTITIPPGVTTVHFT